MSKVILLFLNAYLLIFCSCAGTIDTVRKTEKMSFHKAYIISAENSQYIKFRFGIITPVAYITLPDKASRNHEVIGNTDVVIKRELEKRGISATIGKKRDIANDFDLIVLYNDTWRWDFKKILDKLEIIFISPDGKKEIARSTYNIYPNKELHNFPNPDKEVPKMISQLLKDMPKK